MNSDAGRGPGWWLAAGGALLLAASYVASLFHSASVIDATALRVGASSGSLLLGLGVFYLVGFHGGHPSHTRGGVVRVFGSSVISAPRRDDEAWSAVQELFRAFNENLSHASDRQGLWSAFDQFAREMLARYADTQKVRCFTLREGEDRLRSLSSHGDESAAPSARAGILGHVATSGRAYWSDDRSLGDKVHSLAQDESERWAAAWPVRAEGRTVGVIAAGEVRGETTRAAAVFQCLEFLWRHLELHDHLRTARSTDNATGVLTREEFFSKAAAAIEESNQQHEPIVVTALMLEGLRGLDDKGLWRVRDALVPGVGGRLLEKLRSDDLVGRLSDDRFVILMRRLDSALGRLIAKQLAGDLKAEIARHDDFAGRINVRLGLAGSGLRQASLDDLLTSAWRSVDSARNRGVELNSDAPGGVSPGDKHED